jgi:hypothetical protein
MPFKWKDRDGAVNQAAYQFRKSRENVLEHISKMTPEEIAREKEFFGAGHVIRFDDEGTLAHTVEDVLGIDERSRFKDAFCTTAKWISPRQRNLFLFDVRGEIARRDHFDKFFAERKARKAEQVAS